MDKTTEKFASYAAALSYADLSPKAIYSAKRCIVDSLGCALGAYNAAPVKAARALASGVTAKKPATLIGTQIKSSPDLAGFVNGTMIRYADFSDDYFGGNGKQAGPHPSDNIGSILAVAESVGGNGKTLILGIALAYEACNQLVEHTVLHLQGWDYPVMHSLGTALGAGKVLGLTQEQLGNAIGLAVVPNNCLAQTRIGQLSNWKSMAGPYGSRSGLFAAQLAKEGITGPAEPFEGKAGFMKQLNNAFELGHLGGQGEPFKIEHTFFKYMPVMYAAQLLIWTALETRNRVKIEDIDSIVVYTYAYVLSVNCFDAERWDPKSPETADHSAPYLIGAALVDGKISAETMTPQRYRDPVILDLIKKISAKEDKEYSAAFPRTFNCRFEVTLKSGQVITVHKMNPKGHPDNPMSDAEVEEKFISQTGSLLTPAKTRALLDSLWNVEQLDDVGKLFPMMVVQSDDK